MSILTLQNIAYSYADGTKNVLSGASYQFEQGKFYAIVGNSGTGKSTLLGLLAGLDKPTGGQILLRIRISFSRVILITASITSHSSFRITI